MYIQLTVLENLICSHMFPVSLSSSQFALPPRTSPSPRSVPRLPMTCTHSHPLHSPAVCTTLEAEGAGGRGRRREGKEGRRKEGRRKDGGREQGERVKGGKREAEERAKETM